MLTLIVLDHLANHLSADAAVLGAGEIAVIAAGHVHAHFARNLELHVLQFGLRLLAHCMDSTLSREEDGAINAGYAIWRELIAEVIAFEMDDNCLVIALREKSALLRYYEEEFENGDRKRSLSMILCEALTSKECEMSATWNIAQKKIAGHKPFDNPLFMDMLGLVFRKLRDNLVEIDRDFILELGSFYLCLVTQLEIRKLQKMLAKKSNHDAAIFHSII